MPSECHGSVGVFQLLPRAAGSFLHHVSASHPLLSWQQRGLFSPQLFTSQVFSRCTSAGSVKPSAAALSWEFASFEWHPVLSVLVFQGSDRPQRGQHHSHVERMAEEGATCLPLRGVETDGGAKVSHGLHGNRLPASLRVVQTSIPGLFGFPGGVKSNWMFKNNYQAFICVPGPTQTSGVRNTGLLQGSTMWWSWDRRRWRLPGSDGLTTYW